MANNGKFGDLVRIMALCPLGAHKWVSGEYRLDYPDWGKGKKHPPVFRCEVCGKRK